MKKTRNILIKEVATGSSIELGINPESITVSESRDNIKENIDALGDVYFPGKRGLKLSVYQHSYREVSLNSEGVALYRQNLN